MSSKCTKIRIGIGQKAVQQNEWEEEWKACRWGETVSRCLDMWDATKDTECGKAYYQAGLKVGFRHNASDGIRIVGKTVKASEYDRHPNKMQRVAVANLCGMLAVFVYLGCGEEEALACVKEDISAGNATSEVQQAVSLLETLNKEHAYKTGIRRLVHEAYTLLTEHRAELFHEAIVAG